MQFAAMTAHLEIDMCSWNIIAKRCTD